MKQLSQVELMFNELNGKRAYVYSDGLRIEGNVEQEYSLEFVQHRGLVCKINLKYNRAKLAESIRQMVIDKKELNLDYNQRDELLEALKNYINDSSVQAGTISCYGVESILTRFDKDLICYLEVKYDGGSTVKIRAIK